MTSLLQFRQLHPFPCVFEPLFNLLLYNSRPNLFIRHVYRTNRLSLFDNVIYLTVSIRIEARFGACVLNLERLLMPAIRTVLYKVEDLCPKTLITTG